MRGAFGPLRRGIAHAACKDGHCPLKTPYGTIRIQRERARRPSRLR